MSTNEAIAIDGSSKRREASFEAARFFYAGAAVLLLGLAIWGFEQFYLHGRAYPGRELTTPIRTLVIVHGVGMTAWMVLFVVQTLLVVNRGYRLHMLLGKFGAGLAAVIVYFGVRLGIESTRVAPPDMVMWGLTPREFMAVPLVSISIFAVLVTIGVWKRKRPKVHRPMMLLATLVAITAALDRIDPIKNLFARAAMGRLFGPFSSMLAVGLVLVGLNWLLTRTVDRWLAIGYAGLAVSSALIMVLARSSVWAAFAGWVL